MITRACSTAHPDSGLRADASLTAVLARGRGARPDLPVAPSIDTLVSLQAGRTPEAAAFEDASGVLTYAALERNAVRLGAALAARGLKQGSRVAVCMSRGPELIPTLLAILKTGAAYVPVDITYPPSRVKAMLDDAQPHLIVADYSTRDRIALTSTPVVSCDELMQAGGADPCDSLSTPDDVAYVMYTSGSTGSPKGVCVSHRAIATRVVNTDYISVTRDDRIVFASNISFDAATFEIWGALVNGATLIPLEFSDLAVPGRLATRIKESRATVMFVTPAIFNTIASEMPGAFAPLRVLMFGGEAASPSAVRRVLAAGPPDVLMNVYGPTECTTFATTYRVTEVPEDTSTIPIGTPIAHTDAYVMDESGLPVPDGEAGELYLGGEGLADGYHGNPALTAERFVNGPQHAGRLYRTGDICRWNADGQLEFVGRVDRQIKLRGFRIEPSEIEAALLRHPQISNAVVEAVGENAEDRRLVAYVVPMAGCWPEPLALRGELRRHLPPYMVPSDFVMAEKLRLTANGKVDRTLMPPAAVVRRDRQPLAAPRDALEDELVRIWQDVLGVAPLGIDDDFFELGGHSLIAAAMVARVAETFARHVPLSLLLESPTLGGFADALVKASRENEAEVVAVRTDGHRPPLFFLHGDFNGGGLYCAPLARGLDAQPFYALKPLGCDGADAPASIDEMAARHAAIIRQSRPHGPYLLGGHCNGALEALEIARRLRHEGEEVPCVVLIEPPVIETRLSAVDLPLRIAARVARLDDEQRVDLYLRVREALAETVPPAYTAKLVYRTLRELLRSGIAAGPFTHSAVRQQASRAVLRHDDAVWRRYTRAVAAYAPRRYTGPAAIFVGEELVNTPVDPTAGWRHVGPRFEFHVVPGGHLTCMTLHVGATSAAINQYLKAATGE